MLAICPRLNALSLVFSIGRSADDSHMNTSVQSNLDVSKLGMQSNALLMLDHTCSCATLTMQIVIHTRAFLAALRLA